MKPATPMPTNTPEAIDRPRAIGGPAVWVLFMGSAPPGAARPGIRRASARLPIPRMCHPAACPTFSDGEPVRLRGSTRSTSASPKLAGRWTTADPATRSALSPYEGAEDLNTEAAVALDGVLFLEGEGRPAEITAMIGELRADAD